MTQRLAMISILIPGGLHRVQYVGHTWNMQWKPPRLLNVILTNCGGSNAKRNTGSERSPLRETRGKAIINM